MLYFFHHYELPVILQQAQLQQLLLRSHRGMGMMGLAGIAALASGAAYHDAPGTGTATQATPPTTQSTTQTVQNTAQSTTQTSPSVSTVQTNTTHTGDVLPTRMNAPETIAQGTNTPTANNTDEVAIATQITEVRNSDKDSPSGERDIKIEEITRRNSNAEIKVQSSNNSNAAAELGSELNLPSGASNVSPDNNQVETLDRRRKDSTDVNNESQQLLADNEQVATERLAPRASPEADELD